MANAVIIGGGPAGISAAVYIARAGIEATLLYRDGGALLKAHDIRNYYGFPDGVSGEQLHELGLRQARAAMVCSGTATVETALLHCPLIVVYRTAALTYWFGRRIIRVPWLGMVNLIAGRELCPEFIQEAARSVAMADAVEALAADTPERQVQLAGLAEVARSLEGRQGDIPSAGRLVAEAPARDREVEAHEPLRVGVIVHADVVGEAPDPTVNEEVVAADDAVVEGDSLLVVVVADPHPASTTNARSNTTTSPQVCNPSTARPFIDLSYSRVICEEVYRPIENEHKLDV